MMYFPVKLETEITIETKDTFNKTSYQKEIIINYKEPLTFKQINEVLKFEIVGSKYIYYW